jgi:hypothetical protein
MRKNIIGEFGRGHDMSNEGMMVNLRLADKRISKVVQNSLPVIQVLLVLLRHDF